MTTKHTPGPWHRNIPPAKKYAVIFAGRNTHVAVVCSQGLADEEVEANCDLIKAAPETAAERDRLRAALDALVIDAGNIANFLHNKLGRFGDAVTECKARDLVDAITKTGATCKDALANTSPAPTESVNKELLDALKAVSARISDASGSPSFTAAEHDTLESLITKAEGQ